MTNIKKKDDGGFVPPKSASCKCISYNRPDLGGIDDIVVLPPPPWSKKTGICVDACIAESIRRLWAEGIITRGCCCGHGGRLGNPHVDVDGDYSVAEKVRKILSEIDGRGWMITCTSEKLGGFVTPVTTHAGGDPEIRTHFEVFGREWPESGDPDVAVVRLLEDWKNLAKKAALADGLASELKRLYSRVTPEQCDDSQAIRIKDILAEHAAISPAGEGKP